MRALRFALALSLTVLVACATEPLDTPSGKPEVTINARPDAVASAILVRLAASGWTIDSQTPTGVTAHKKMDGMQAVATQLLIGNEYSTIPDCHLRFIIIGRLGDPTRVFAQASASTQMAFGQVNEADITTGSSRDLQQILAAVKKDAEAESLAPTSGARPRLNTTSGSASTR